MYLLITNLIFSFIILEFTLDEKDSPEFRRIHEEYTHLVCQ